MQQIRRLKETMRNWLWPCPLLALALAAAVLAIWGLARWTAIIAALLLVSPALIVWGAVTLSRNGSQGYCSTKNSGYLLLGVFLKSDGLEVLWRDTLALVAIGAVLLSASVMRLHRRI